MPQPKRGGVNEESSHAEKIKERGEIALSWSIARPDRPANRLREGVKECYARMGSGNEWRGDQKRISCCSICALKSTSPRR